MNYRYLISLSLFTQCLFSQSKVDKAESLNQIVIDAPRIELPFSENSRSITLITKDQIKKAAVTSVAQLLQYVAGIDIRQRGVDGMQADLYIRGGSFDQTLLLIDGIAVEDSQTGHHLLNSLPALDNIKRIEIIKGPAAGIYGQNAFTGAINIITKKANENKVSVNAFTGSFNHTSLDFQFNSKTDNYAEIVAYKRNTSAGYRYNTDFKNDNLFYKSNFKIDKVPVQILATYGTRHFGANGFYASPSYKDQYEETQTSLIGVQTDYSKAQYTLKSKLYWRRNQDMYLFLRQNPSYYRNFHITNKVGGALNASIKSKAGITGLGLDISKNYIVSNNLGTHNRTEVNAFIEHRFSFMDNQFDVTPGVALNYYSDFKFHAFPGIEFGYALSPKTRLYGNIGYTYRIPTYTDLYYTSPITVGNANLKPESALAEELGLKYTTSQFRFDVALFNRHSNNLIDYVKFNQADPWQASNLIKVNSYGFEVNTHYNFKLFNFTQSLKLGYNYLKDNLQHLEVPFTQYSLNSMKHQVVSSLNAQLIKHISQTLAYRFVQRPDGTHYTVVDAKVNLIVNNLKAYVSANNIFNAAYSETSLVPMPKSNYLISIGYTFK